MLVFLKSVHFHFLVMEDLVMSQSIVRNDTNVCLHPDYLVCSTASSLLGLLILYLQNPWSNINPSTEFTFNSAILYYSHWFLHHSPIIIGRPFISAIWKMNQIASYMKSCYLYISKNNIPIINQCHCILNSRTYV